MENKIWGNRWIKTAFLLTYSPTIVNSISLLLPKGKFQESFWLWAHFQTHQSDGRNLRVPFPVSLPTLIRKVWRNSLFTRLNSSEAKWLPWSWWWWRWWWWWWWLIFIECLLYIRHHLGHVTNIMSPNPLIWSHSVLPQPKKQKLYLFPFY